MRRQRASRETSQRFEKCVQVHLRTLGFVVRYLYTCIFAVCVCDCVYSRAYLVASCFHVGFVLLLYMLACCWLLVLMVAPSHIVDRRVMFLFSLDTPPAPRPGGGAALQRRRRRQSGHQATHEFECTHKSSSGANIVVHSTVYGVFVWLLVFAVAVAAF